MCMCISICVCKKATFLNYLRTYISSNYVQWLQTCNGPHRHARSATVIRIHFIQILYAIFVCRALSSHALTYAVINCTNTHGIFCCCLHMQYIHHRERTRYTGLMRAKLMYSRSCVARAGCAHDNVYITRMSPLCPAQRLPRVCPHD